MRQECFKITVPGQLTGEAVLTAMILDNISVEPEKKRPVVIVCPGGGYRVRSDREREAVALQLMSEGYHVCILDYSVGPNRFPVAVMELARAVAIVRESCGKWNGAEDKILVCGFSAGGHLACSIGTFWDRDFVYGPIGHEAEEIKPNGLILCYPVISSGEFAHRGSFEHLLGELPSDEELELVSLEKQVTKQMPTAFIWHTTSDESVPVENSLMLAASMQREGVPFELHIYPVGGHGLSLANKETSGSQKPNHLVAECQSWMPLLKTWIGSRFA